MGGAISSFFANDKEYDRGVSSNYRYDIHSSAYAQQQANFRSHRNLEAHMPYRVSVPRTEETQVAELIRNIQTLQVTETPAKPVIANLSLIENLFNDSVISWTYDIDYNKPYELQDLDILSQEFIQIKRSFRSTNKKCFKVQKIVKVINPYLMLQYELRKQQYKRRYGQVTELKLFHGTKLANLHSICTHSFNWRLNGQARGHKFGQGVSFTPIANYATHYGDKTDEKIMFVAMVIVSNSCLGNRDMILPHDNYDTTTNEKKHVYVKYEDHTFYPAYIISYTGVDIYANMKQTPRKQYSYIFED